jgi:hypothetical protein
MCSLVVEVNDYSVGKVMASVEITPSNNCETTTTSCGLSPVKNDIEIRLVADFTDDCYEFVD